MSYMNAILLFLTVAFLIVFQATLTRLRFKHRHIWAQYGSPKDADENAGIASQWSATKLVMLSKPSVVSKGDTKLRWMLIGTRVLWCACIAGLIWAAIEFQRA